MKCSNKYFGEKGLIELPQRWKGGATISESAIQRRSLSVPETQTEFTKTVRHCRDFWIPMTTRLSSLLSFKNCRHILFKCSLLLASGPRVGLTETNLKNRIQLIYFKINIGAQRALLAPQSGWIFVFFSTFFFVSLSQRFVLPSRFESGMFCLALIHCLCPLSLNTQCVTQSWEQWWAGDLEDVVRSATNYSWLNID